MEHRADFSKVADMHEASVEKMSDVIGEAKVWSKIRPKLRTEEFEVNVWVNEESRLREIDGLEFSLVALEGLWVYIQFWGVQPEEIGGHPGGNVLDYM